MRKTRRKPRQGLLVQATATKLRKEILSKEPGSYLGSFKDLSNHLGVGVVTMQQATRILEHEGLLEIRRGPGGGYYGLRPDDAAMERAFSTYMHIHSFGHKEALEMMSLLDCGLIPIAAASEDQSFRTQVKTLQNELENCSSQEERVEFERKLREALFTVVKRPFFELINKITFQIYLSQPVSQLFQKPDSVENWKNARNNILEAILKKDVNLARFEANRFREIVEEYIQS